MRERRELPFSWDDLKGRLQGEILRLLPALGIHDQPRGGMVLPLNPTRNDRKPGSFVIWTTHGRDGATGAWKDYATGEAGDVFDLIAYLMRLQAKMDAYWWALDFLHLGRGNVRTKAGADLDRERFERERKAAAARAEKESEERSALLFRRWLSLPPIAGTIAETYLRAARRIPLDRLPELPGALRFEAAADHVDKETGEVTTWPAICSAVTRGKKVTGLHRTFLMPDGSGKAAVKKAKIMYGTCRGGAIRLAKGDGKLSPNEAERRGVAEPLILGEGIETTLTVACARPDYRAWAAGSLSFMQVLDWPACASAVILLRDNDEGPGAQAAFERVEAHWRSQAKGRPVKVVASQAGSDFNDWVKG